MPKYLVHAAYSAEGAKGVMKNGGTARADAVRKAVEGMGGTIQAFDGESVGAVFQVCLPVFAED